MEDKFIIKDCGWGGIKTISDSWVIALLAKAITYEEYVEYQKLSQEEQQVKLNWIKNGK